MIENWKLNDRIKQKSVLKVESKLQSKYSLPLNRQLELPFHQTAPPNKNKYKAEVIFDLTNPVSKSNTDPAILQLEGLKTIQSYPDEWIQIYTDGSATNGTKNGGLGIRVEFTDNSIKEISNPCGVLCSNFDAEAKAIETAL